MSLKRKIVTVDLFCGAGGASSGIHQAAEELGYDIKNYVVNHWDVAIETHSQNHPSDTHRCAPVESIIPSEYVAGGVVDVLWASPSCTHHSRAKGGKPRDNQLRAQPNLVLDWLDMLHVRRLIVENVPEFRDWGPLGRDGKQIQRQKGKCFEAWLAGLTARNYRFECKILNCADYGDHTTRKRFFLQAVKIGCGKIRWPEPGYAENPSNDLFRDQKKWRGIGECLDLGDIGTPISKRKKPLARATMLRIAEGLRKFHGEQFVMDFLGTDKPESSGRLIGTDKPITTQHCSNRYGLATPFIIDFLKNGKVKGVGEPINTQHCKDRFEVATPFVVKWERNSNPIAMDEPISTQTTSNKFTLCTPIIVDFANGGRVRGSHEPMPTLTAKNSMCVATPIIYDYGNGGKVKSANDPMPTQTTRGNMSVAFPVTNEGRLVDVCFRMLSPQELKMATGFSKEYILCGTKTEMVKQIGNAVPVNTARELVKAALIA